ncbi:GNAT family N-acetyltransferase [Phytoactinopolyspora alkaliphila]|uniref:GNAT family N-acetyltransferase n=2 Tax=Phytoactinopolyspora alkaliphila TaxID=1783498 RepID=A0A6N9YTP2_9ACTN|nr:GNAT family N-acetyltransferase [Phytoactinopolyspora alkaliphila]
MRIRPMRRTDVEAVERVTDRAFRPAGGGRSTVARHRWIKRLAHFLDVDPGGCWVAEDQAGVAGVAVALRRDEMWVLSTLAVDPAHQGRGIGKALFDAAVAYGDGCLRGMLCAMPNHAALRRYRHAGFTLYPTLRLSGTVDPGAAPDVGGVRVGSQSDLDLVDSVDRRVRGATHRADHAFLATGGPLLVCDILTGSGYVYLDQFGVGPLAATSRAVAQRLLWAALNTVPPGEELSVRHLTSDQEWALDVGLAAGLRVETDGCLALRHMRPPAPYVPSVFFG